MNTRSRANVSRREASSSTPAAGRRRPAWAPVAPGTTATMSGTSRGALAAIRATVGAADGGVYLGAGSLGPAWARSEQAVLVLGPPRSGKTSSIVVPTILGAPGAVVSTSTKPDVLRATARRAPRSDRACSTTRAAPSRRLAACSACAGHRCRAVARGTTRCSSPGASWARRDPAPVPAQRRGAGGADHWTERAEALLAPALHAAALDGADLATVLSWVDRRNAATALGILDRNGATRPGDLLAGIAATDPREQSGIWSTASGVLGRLPQRGRPGHAPWPRTSTPAPSATRRPRSISVPPAGTRPWPRPWWWGCSPTSAPPPTPGRPRSRRAEPGRRAAGAPVVLALDEVANIAPIPDLPSMVSEGGWPGTSHPGVPPGPLPGPGPVGRRRRRLLLPVRHHRGAPRDRGRAHARGAVRPRR